MKVLIGSLVVSAAMFSSFGTANACCGYGCCDCSCVAIMNTADANNIVNEIEALLRKNGYEAQTIDIVVRDDKQTIVLHKDKGKSVEQPGAGRN
ncbi:hypothetical protein [Roseibium marinum]|uniref:hypothetical protein n=1 Tax=Roseibium marinum TaxID=281252 RepID=UPI0011AF8A58|nr:hypothetical protein [Roseibium marinum]